MKKGARKTIPVSEREVLDSCLEWLAMKRLPHFRINSGAMKGEHNGKKRYVPFVRIFIPGEGYTERGMSDICALIRTWPVAGGGLTPRFVAIEVKRPGEHSTLEQVQFQKAVRAAGHLAFEVHSVDELEAMLRAEGFR